MCTDVHYLRTGPITILVLCASDIILPPGNKHPSILWVVHPKGFRLLAPFMGANGAHCGFKWTGGGMGKSIFSWQCGAYGKRPCLHRSAVCPLHYPTCSCLMPLFETSLSSANNSNLVQELKSSYDAPLHTEVIQADVQTYKCSSATFCLTRKRKTLLL